jgi:hypothetical protein
MIAHPHRFAFFALVGVGVLWLVAMVVMTRNAALDANATGSMLVVFDPGISEDDAFAAITRAGAKPLKATSLAFIWVVDGSAGALEREGALGAYRELPISPAIAGCVAVVDAKAAEVLGL